jgi:hypothetical protein
LLEDPLCDRFLPAVRPPRYSADCPAQGAIIAPHGTWAERDGRLLESSGCDAVFADADGYLFIVGRLEDAYGIFDLVG